MQTQLQFGFILGQRGTLNTISPPKQASIANSYSLSVFYKFFSHLFVAN